MFSLCTVFRRIKFNHYYTLIYLSEFSCVSIYLYSELNWKRMPYPNKHIHFMMMLLYTVVGPWWPSSKEHNNKCHLSHARSTTTFHPFSIALTQEFYYHHSTIIKKKQIILSLNFTFSYRIFHVFSPTIQ